MRKIIVTEFITLDGVIEAPGGDETDHPNGGWQRKFHSPETGKYKLDELSSVDALLLGRKTYDAFAAYWPGQAENAFGAPINSLPKYVVSKSLKSAEWNNSHIIRDVAKDIADLKQTAGGNILVYGSGTLVKSLIHSNLVDELRLLLHPVVVGGGLGLFNDNREFRNFELKHSHAFPNGVLLLEYLPNN